MKVAHVLPYLPPKIGGRELWIKWMAPELVKRGVDIVIFASNVKDYHKYEHKAETETWNIPDSKKTIKIYRANTLYNNDQYSTPLVIPQLLTLMKENPDIIHLHEPNLFLTTAYGLFAKVFMRKKILLHCHSDAFKWKGLPWYLAAPMTAYQWIYWLKLKIADRVLGVSKEYMENSEQLKKFKNKSEVFPMSLAPGFTVKTEEENNRFKRSIGIPENKQVVLYVGRLDPRKGVNYLIDAVKKLPNTFLLIVGSGDENSTNTLKKQVKKNDMEKRTAFVPTVMQKELNDYYNAADVLALPTNDLTETFGVVLIEAWATKTPVVVTNIPAPAKMTEECKGGLVAKKMDSDDIAEKLQFILTNKAFADHLGNNGYNFVTKNLSFPKLADKLVKIYKEML